MKAIRWSDHDRYLGPFTYAYEPRYRRFSVIFGSGDGDDYPGCRLCIAVGAHTLIIALPAIIKPYRHRKEFTTEPTRSQVIARGQEPFYFESHERELGFTAVEGALHVYYGRQTHDSETTKSKLWFFPWREHKMIRHSLYDLEGDHFATLPEWGFRHKNGWEVRNAIEEVCPTQKFAFKDFDGEDIIATTKIEEREWQRGKGVFRLFYLGRNKVNRSLDLQFSSEVGKRKGSWKGGTIGHGIDMLPGELHAAAFKRYCEKQGLTFVGKQ